MRDDATGFSAPLSTERVAAASSASPDIIWATLRAEAVAAIEQDRVMADPICGAVLRHEDFSAALAARIAGKLADATLGATPLAALLAEALDGDPDLVEASVADLAAVRDRDPACPDLLTPFLYFKGYQAIQAHRLAHHLFERGRMHLARHLQSRAAEVFAIDIHPAARLGRRILLDHGTGLVVGETAVIEDDVSILQGVTLGGTGKSCGDRHPKIRRGVLLGAGATVLGNIEVGEGAKIGAGSIVLQPVPPHTTVVGNPARPVGTRHPGQMPALTMDHTLPALNYEI